MTKYLTYKVNGLDRVARREAITVKQFNNLFRSNRLAMIQRSQYNHTHSMCYSLLIINSSGHLHIYTCSRGQIHLVLKIRTLLEVTPKDFMYHEQKLMLIITPSFHLQ